MHVGRANSRKQAGLGLWIEECGNVLGVLDLDLRRQNGVDFGGVETNRQHVAALLQEGAESLYVSGQCRPASRPTTSTRSAAGSPPSYELMGTPENARCRLPAASPT